MNLWKYHQQWTTVKTIAVSIRTRNKPMTSDSEKTRDKDSTGQHQGRPLLNGTRALFQGCRDEFKQYIQCKLVTDHFGKPSRQSPTPHGLPGSRDTQPVEESSSLSLTLSSPHHRAENKRSYDVTRTAIQGSLADAGKNNQAHDLGLHSFRYRAASAGTADCSAFQEL